MKLILNFESICNEKMGSIVVFLCFLGVSAEVFCLFFFTITGKIHWRIGGRNKIEIAYIHDFRIIVYVEKFHSWFEESRAKLKMLNAAKLKLEWFSK